MSTPSKSTIGNRWNSVTTKLLRWVDPDRGAELLTHIEDATEAGEPLTPGDAASVFGMAARTQSYKLLGELRLAMIGLPVALLCVMAYGAIYESHFAPWDLMEEFNTTDPQVALIRQLVDLAWVVLIPLGLLSGWAVVKSVASRRFVLPSIYVVALVALIGQSNIFIERTEWFGDTTLKASHVDSVSPYSLGLLSLVFVLPLAYLGVDTATRLRRRSQSGESGPGLLNREQPLQPGEYDSIALGAIFSPFLMLLVPIVPILLFLILVFVAPTFRLRHKIAAVAVIIAPGATYFAITQSGGGIDDPGPGTLMFLGAFLAVWGWLAIVTLGLRTPQK